MGDALSASLHEHRVVQAADGVRALELASMRPALAILCDGPTVDARSIAAELRRDQRFGNPVIFVVAAGAARDPGLAGLADECIEADRLDLSALPARVRGALQRAAAMRDASPLTGLPGNAAIAAELQRRLTEGAGAALLYADLDNFKAVNDHYGFLRGDDVITGLAAVLRGVAAERERVFLGHVGGDDFIVICSPGECEEIGATVVERFAAIADGFYDPEDLARGGIHTEDRQGVRRHFPVVSLSIGVATTRSRVIEDHRELVTIATEMKHLAKGTAGNAIRVDRRTRADGDRSARQSGALTGSRGPGGGRARVIRASRPQRSTRSVRTRLGAVALVTALLAVGLPGGVSMASSAAPGSSLWGARLQVEALRVRLAGDPASQLRVRLTLAQAHLDELRALTLQGADPALIRMVSQALELQLAAVGAELATGRVEPGVDAGQLALLRDEATQALGAQRDALLGLQQSTCARDGARATCRALEAALGDVDRIRGLAGVDEPAEVAAGGAGAAEETTDQTSAPRGGGTGEDTGAGSAADQGRPAAPGNTPVRRPPAEIAPGAPSGAGTPAAGTAREGDIVAAPSTGASTSEDVPAQAPTTVSPEAGPAGDDGDAPQADPTDDGTDDSVGAPLGTDSGGGQDDTAPADVPIVAPDDAPEQLVPSPTQTDEPTGGDEPGPPTLEPPAVPPPAPAPAPPADEPDDPAPPADEPDDPAPPADEPDDPAPPADEPDDPAPPADEPDGPEDAPEPPPEETDTDPGPVEPPEPEEEPEAPDTDPPPVPDPDPTPEPTPEPTASPVPIASPEPEPTPPPIPAPLPTPDVTPTPPPLPVDPPADPGDGTDDGEPGEPDGDPDDGVPPLVDPDEPPFGTRPEEEDQPTAAAVPQGWASLAVAVDWVAALVAGP